jgi:SAM-dependent methyltransferase
VASGSIASCLSNSVLEHLPDLDRCFSEVARSLKPGGRFVFTMTLGVFTDHLRRLAGNADARRWTDTFGHLQQPSKQAVIELLARHGLQVEKAVEYQSLPVTALYRFLVSPVFQFFERRAGGVFARRLKGLIIGKVERSIRETGEGQGACCFIVARKK